MHILQKSSLTIFIPIVYFYKWGCVYDVYVLTAQGISSFIHHTYYTNTTLTIDRLMIVVLLSRSFYNSIMSYIAIKLYVLYVFYLFYIYIYGYFTYQYSFHPNLKIACKYHATLHVIGTGLYTIAVYLVKNKTC